MYQKLASGAGEEELFSAMPNDVGHPSDWAPDGGFLLVSSHEKTGYTIWALSSKRNEKSFPVVKGRDGQFSPDGHWIAYQSNESGRLEVYPPCQDS